MMKKAMIWVLSLCLLLGGFTGAQAAQTSDFDALLPLMNLVATAAMRDATDEQLPVVIGDETTTLDSAFAAAFFANAMNLGAYDGITADVLQSADQQAAYLAGVFAAKAPALGPVTQAQPITGIIGFRPVTVSTLDNGDAQIIGELYWAAKPLDQLTETEFQDVRWLDRAVFTVRSAASARYGSLIVGFSVGSELDMEAAMQDYFEEILVEYVNTNLGFEVQYPSVFTDDMLQEDGDGVSATLPDGSVSFFTKRVENASQDNLTDYVNVIAGGIAGSKLTLNETFSYATLSYDTEEGNSVFDVYIVTDKYIYQAELSYKKELSSTYNMYRSYLENSFLVYEVSVG